jgi:hypothetical protein
MSPLPSKFLIWWHEPITSPLEMTVIGNFHQVHDATSSCLSVSNAEKVCFNSASASTGRRDRR